MLLLHQMYPTSGYLVPFRHMYPLTVKYDDSRPGAVRRYGQVQGQVGTYKQGPVHGQEALIWPWMALIQPGRALDGSNTASWPYI